MADLRMRLLEGPCVLLDGGMGSILLGQGLSAGDAPERLNLERPETVRAVHEAHVAAGSEAVHTNSFGGTPARLRHFGLDERCADINRRAVEIAREAGPVFVIGDIGPTGQYLPPVGSGDVDHWHHDFCAQAKALLDAGVDGLHLETMSDLREALTALAAIRELSVDIPVLCSLTFDRKKRGFYTVMGDALVPSLRQLDEAGATAVGANCTLDSGGMRELAAAAQAEIEAPLVFQANAGQPQTTRDGVRYDQDPARFASDLRGAIEGGAAAVGGCCGTDSRFIAQLARLLGHA